jgi:hypothetical protein
MHLDAMLLLGMATHDIVHGIHALGGELRPWRSSYTRP